MPRIYKGTNIFGEKIIRVEDYEICKSSGKWEIIHIRPYSRNVTYYGLWDRVPSFPNMMQAYRFLKENWSTII